MHELVIRGGRIVDGSGGAIFDGDVAVEAGRLVQVGGRAGRGCEEIDARGRLVTPGWVDIHSHYDGQATWDPYLTPSGGHGVTTVVMGNCGIGFAPARPQRRDWLINVMEGVEDIPGTALHEGIRWRWESFPEYLDALADTPRALDVAAQVPHSALRDYVMGDRGATRAAAGDDEIARMAALLGDALRAGAVGFSTSRTRLHLAADGSAVAGSFADERELGGLAEALRAAGHGVFQLVSDFRDAGAEFAGLRRLALRSGVPVHYVLVQDPEAPGKWRTLLQLTDAAAREGAALTALVGCRPVGMLINLDSRHHPFSEHLSYRRIAALPLAERLRRLREPGFRAQLLAERPSGGSAWWRTRLAQYENLYRLGDPPDYEPAPERSIAAIAARQSREPEEVVYDILAAGDGSDWLYRPLFNYADASYDALQAMLAHPHSVLSLADGGAHCGLICDASAPTFLLTHWVRDRVRGPRLPLERAVAMQSARTAAAYGLRDRGRLAPGLRADLNVIDFERLHLQQPRWANDLPASGRRLLQPAQGYVATVCAGRVTWRDGAPTGELPGRVVRGAAVA